MRVPGIAFLKVLSSAQASVDCSVGLSADHSAVLLAAAVALYSIIAQRLIATNIIASQENMEERTTCATRHHAVGGAVAPTDHRTVYNVNVLACLQPLDNARGGLVKVLLQQI